MKLLFLFLTLGATSLFAHSGHNDNGFLSGISHPVLGLDHLLAMLSVGLLSASKSRKEAWLYPTFFVLFMLVGGMSGLMGLTFGSVEFNIALSVLLLGLALWNPSKIKNLFLVLPISFFGIYHGIAHGAEIPETAKPALYVTGFLLGTVGIHLMGFFSGEIFKIIKGGEKIRRAVALGFALLGVGFLV